LGMSGGSGAIVKINLHYFTIWPIRSKGKQLCSV
jgi:hypothetical protein